MRKQEKNQPASRWQLDRRIPLAIVLTLLMQLAGALFWAAQLDARVIRVEQQSLGIAQLNVRFARLEERLDNVKQDTDTMKRLLAHLAQQLLNPRQ